MKINRYKISKDEDINLYLDDYTFEPTITTDLIIESASKNIIKDSSILDLGCGSGVVAIALSKISKFNHFIFASDLSKTVEKIVKKNAVKNKVEIVVKRSNLFENWDRKFDYIIDDVSGISSEVAKISPWFENISCESGVNGDLLTRKVLRESPSFLEKNGTIFFPVISLSNVSLILEEAKNNFKNVERIGHKEWPLPKIMLEEKKNLQRLKESGNIDFNEKFGILIGSTSIYKAYN